MRVQFLRSKWCDLSGISQCLTSFKQRFQCVCKSLIKGKRYIIVSCEILNPASSWPYSKAYITHMYDIVRERDKPCYGLHALYVIDHQTSDSGYIQFNSIPVGSKLNFIQGIWPFWLRSNR